MEKERRTNESWVGQGMAIGVAIGVAIDAALDNTSTGIAVGVAIGAGIGSVWDRQQSKKNGQSKNSVPPDGSL